MEALLHSAELCFESTCRGDKLDTWLGKCLQTTVRGLWTSVTHHQAVLLGMPLVDVTPASGSAEHAA